MYGEGEDSVMTNQTIDVTPDKYQRDVNLNSTMVNNSEHSGSAASCKPRQMNEKRTFATNAEDDYDLVPPDGGWGWVVAVSTCFIAVSVVFVLLCVLIP